jgi:hypothetical protein
LEGVLSVTLVEPCPSKLSNEKIAHGMGTGLLHRPVFLSPPAEMVKNQNTTLAQSIAYGEGKTFLCEILTSDLPVTRYKRSKVKKRLWLNR